MAGGCYDVLFGKVPICTMNYVTSGLIIPIRSFADRVPFRQCILIGDRGQSRTSIKRTVLNKINTFWNCDGDKVGTSVECKCANTYDTVGNSDCGQFGTTAKCFGIYYSCLRMYAAGCD